MSLFGAAPMAAHATSTRRLRIAAGVRAEFLARLSLTGAAGMRTGFCWSFSWHLVPFLSPSGVNVGLEIWNILKPQMHSHTDPLDILIIELPVRRRA